MNERQIKLYDLLFSQDKHITAKVLAAKLKVTPKTIYLDVKAIEDEFTGFGLYIDRRPNQGLKLIGSIEEKQRLKNQLHMTKEAETDEFSLETRRQRIFKELLVEGKNLSLQDFAEQYFVSKTAILNDLDYFSRFMKPSNVQFETINKKIEVVGKSADIQSAIVNYLLHISNENREQKDSLLRKCFGDMLFSAVQSIYSGSGLIDLSNMNEYYEESLLLNLLVFAARILAGKHYQSSNSLLANGKNRETYYLACDLCSLIAKRTEIVFQADDIEVLSQLLFAHKAFPAKKQNQSWGETVDELICRLEQITDIVLDDTSELKGQLLSHLPAMVIRLSNGLRISNPFLSGSRSAAPYWKTMWRCPMESRSCVMKSQLAF